MGSPSQQFEPRPPLYEAYDYPDTECDGWSAGRLSVRYASVRGASHRYYGRPRQDAIRTVFHEPSGTVAFAVADGVSSAARAEAGAREACRTAIDVLYHQLSSGARHPDFDEVLGHAAVRLTEATAWLLERPGQAVEAEEVARLCATTLVAGIARVADDRLEVEVCRVGDSSAWVLEPPQHYRPLFETRTDEVVISTAVMPLPHLPAETRPVAEALPPGAILLVGTDGIGDPLGDGDGKVGALLAGLLDGPPPPAWFAHLVGFSRRTFDDDRTLLAVWPGDPRERP